MIDNDKPREENEQSYIDESGSNQKLHLDILLKALVQRCMGRALDEARVSSMSDRSLVQFSKTIKDDFYKIINDGRKILKDFGYEVTDDTKWNKK